MPTLEVSRTLVKSPPELWMELRGERLADAVGAAKLVVAEEERRIEWETEGARGAAVLEPAGWGTRLTLTAEVDGGVAEELEQEVERLEPRVARGGLWARLRRVKPPDPEPDPEPEPEPPTPHAGLQQALEGLLDDLGSAHRKPFKNG